MEKTKQVAKPEPYLVPLSDVISMVKNMLDDAEFEASKSTGSPKVKRERQRTLNGWYSFHTYLTELQTLKAEQS